MNYTPSPSVTKRLAALETQNDEPCTGEPARDAVAKVVTVLDQFKRTLVLELRQQPIEVVDFYKLEAA